MDRRRLSDLLEAFGDTPLAEFVGSGDGEWAESIADVEVLRQIYRRRLRRSDLDRNLRQLIEGVLVALDRPDAAFVTMLHFTSFPGRDAIILVDERCNEVIGILPANSERQNTSEDCGN